MTQPLGVILAGGLARRMGGGDKGQLMLGGESLLSRVHKRLAPQVGAMALNANGDPDRFSGIKMPIIQDNIPGFAGPLAGVLAGLDWAAEQGAGSIVTAAADTPFFPQDLVQRLQEASDGQEHPLVLSATKDAAGKTYRHPTFGLWPVELRDDLRRSLQDGLRKVVLWTDRHKGRQTVFETGAIDPFFNVNTPDDLASAEAMLKDQI